MSFVHWSRIMKLPGHLQRKWDERVVEFASMNYDLYADFEVFAREVRKYARLKNHPNVTVYENLRIDIPRGRKDRYKDEDHRILKGNTESQSPSSEEKHCQFHDRQGHDILERKAFARKTLQQRSDWTKKSGLCFRCFAKGHIAKNCKIPVKCQKCDSVRHLTLFHFDQQKKSEREDQKEEVTSSCTDLCSGTQGLPCSKIVLLDVFLEREPDKCIEFMLS